MNILVLTGAYYPVTSSPSSCIDKYLRKLASDNSIDIITPRTSFSQSMDKIDGMSLHYVNHWSNSIRVWSKDNIKRRKWVGLSKFVFYLTRLYGVAISSFSFPTRDSWLKIAYYKKAKSILSQKNIDVIISVSNPICTHIAAKRIKESHPTLRWITYFTDPYSFYEPIYEHVLFKKQRRKKNLNEEFNIYETSDYIILTEELYENAIVKFRQSPSKTICFPYVLKQLLAPEERKKERNRNEEREPSVLYAGALKHEIRYPEFALSVFHRTKGLQLYLYQQGNSDTIIQKYAAPHIHVNKLVDKESYINMIYNEYDILLNIGNKTSLQAPSKMLELISTGRPIINFYHTKDSQFQMIEKYPLGLNVGRDDEDVIKKVEEFCLNNKDKRLSFQQVSEMYPSNSFDRQYDTLCELIRR